MRRQGFVNGRARCRFFKGHTCAEHRPLTQAVRVSVRRETKGDGMGMLEITQAEKDGDSAASPRCGNAGDDAVVAANVCHTLYGP